MSPDDVFVQDLARLLDRRAGTAHAGYLAETLERTSGAAQKPWWSSPERWLPMDLAVQRVAYGPSSRSSLVLLALIAALVIAAVLAMSGGMRPRLPAPFGPAANGPVLFNHEGDIWTGRADGSASRPLITGPEEDWDAWYAYDGSRFAWNRLHGGGKDLLIANADGSDPIQLNDAPFIASAWWDWSPRGDAIAVIHEVDGISVVSIVPTDGSRKMRTLAPGLAVDWVYWRPPDGRELILRGHPLDDPSLTALYAVRADAATDATQPRQLTVLVPGDESIMEPRLSPDGRTAVYWDHEPGSTERRAASAASWIYVVDLDSGGGRRVRFDPYALSESRPIFSPDGKSVLFLRESVVDDGSVTAQLVLAPADGSGAGRALGPTIATDGVGTEWLFAPDGESILLTATTEDHLVDLPSHVIDVRYGTWTTGTRETHDLISFYPSWQRRLPPDH
jgi:hypothetical protein